nr:hypothetical protein BaRGS_012431 [Batillaria attramentaria]
MLSVVLLAGLQGVAHGQNYHYSNGWHPGKRSRPLAASLFRASMGRMRPAADTFQDKTGGEPTDSKW